ncbi:LacI family DNA-binding transcriptional regulator [Salinicoccus sesuvii]|uniref:LacI family DNA-binding transcriptional regulator n=1 Tax=Salinicoccus sesuvii TaxID=868281 RepID=A0ABV7N7K3_9STAP
MVTLKDLAKEVGVSVATVSRVLNNSGYASPEMRKRVMQAAERMNYKPNEVARALNTSRSNIIGVLVPDISNPYFPKVIRGIEDEAIKNNYRILIGNTDHDFDKESKYLEIFNQNNCAGIISATWTVTRQDNLTTRPVVLLDRVVKEHISIEADNLKGGKLQAHHLIQQGVHHVLLIKGLEDYSSFENRTLGSREVLGENQVPYEILSHTALNGTLESGDIAFLEKFDGIICPNDLVAYRVLNVLINHGVSVPDQVKVIGYDNLDFSQYVYPSLTTIEQPIYQLGRNAFKMLMKMNQGIEVESEVLDVKLIKRNST